MAGKLFVVGFGPGSVDHMTKRAREAIEESDVIVGYKTYVDLVKDLIHGKEVICTGMTEEVGRAQEAIKQAERGKKVAVISSGDAGLYGMAGLVYEVLIEKDGKRNRSRGGNYSRYFSDSFLRCFVRGADYARCMYD